VCYCRHATAGLALPGSARVAAGILECEFHTILMASGSTISLAAMARV
jgi:hypothetical protein